jgi:antitoxin VapB
MLQIRNEHVNRLAEKLAAIKRLTKTDAVRLALENELRRIEDATPLIKRLRPVTERIAARPPTGLEADKAFFDALNGEQ